MKKKEIYYNLLLLPITISVRLWFGISTLNQIDCKTK